MLRRKDKCNYLLVKAHFYKESSLMISAICPKALFRARNVRFLCCIGSGLHWEQKFQAAKQKAAYGYTLSISHLKTKLYLLQPKKENHHSPYIFSLSTSLSKRESPTISSCNLTYSYLNISDIIFKYIRTIFFPILKLKNS